MGKVLFIRGGAVGDFILTLPAIKLVRDTLPDNEIEILGYPSITELALATGLADRTRSIEDARLASFFAPGALLDPGWCDYLASFDVVVSYLYDPDGFFQANLEKAGVKTLIAGRFRPDETEPHVSAARQLAQPLESLALFLENPSLRLEYPVSEPLSRSGAGPLIAIHPGSGSPRKNWAFESWAEVLSTLAERKPGAEFLVTSGEAETEVIPQFLAMLDDEDISYRHIFGRSLAELGGLFRQVDLYLGHDSGISHLAASAGVRGILLFGPTNPRIWAPESNRITCLASASGSLSAISPQHVLEQIELSPE